MQPVKTKTCTIADNCVTVNCQKVFESSPDLEFTAFAKLAFKHLNIDYPKFYKMDRLCKLGFLAAEYLFSNIEKHPPPDESAAIILSSSSGSLHSDMLHRKNIEQPGPAIFVYTLPSIVAGEIAIRHGIRGETAFFICKNDDDTIAMQYATELLTTKKANSSIAGWVDYSDTCYLARLSWITNEKEPLLRRNDSTL